MADVPTGSLGRCSRHVSGSSLPRWNRRASLVPLRRPRHRAPSGGGARGARDTLSPRSDRRSRGGCPLLPRAPSARALSCLGHANMYVAFGIRTSELQSIEVDRHLRSTRDAPVSGSPTLDRHLPCRYYHLPRSSNRSTSAGASETSAAPSRGRGRWPRRRAPPRATRRARSPWTTLAPSPRSSSPWAAPRTSPWASRPSTARCVPPRRAPRR